MFVNSATLARSSRDAASARAKRALLVDAPRSAHPTVSSKRLRERLEALSVFGRPEGGTFGDGVSRVAYSDADIQGRSYVMRLFREIRLAARIDQAGNIIGRREGADAAARPIVCGSHIDSVPNGGNFDGALGVMAAIEALQAIAEAGVTTRHPIEVVAWSREEGVAFGHGLFGSRAAVGEPVADELGQLWNGMTMAEAIKRIGGDPVHITQARRAPGSIHCYLELHVEQGGILDKAHIPIGIVEGIVASDRSQVVIRGVANHAGTTPMADRHDALVAAAHLTLAVQSVVTAAPGRQVGTVGKLDVTPNAPGVIPGVVRMTIQLNDLSGDKVHRLSDEVKARASEIASATRTDVEFISIGYHAAAATDPAIQEVIVDVSAAVGLKTTRLPSGAGHDAQMMARLGPMAMIFVPSIGGISHSPQELTTWDDCSRGATVLLETILKLDEMGLQGLD